MKKIFIMIGILYASCLVAGDEHQSDLVERYSRGANRRLADRQFAAAGFLIRRGAMPDCEQISQSVVAYKAAANNEDIFGYFLRCLKEHRTSLTGLPNKIEEIFIENAANYHDCETALFVAKKVEQTEKGLFSTFGADLLDRRTLERIVPGSDAAAQCRELRHFLLSTLQKPYRTSAYHCDCGCDSYIFDAK